MKRAAAVARAQKYLFVWLENLYVADGGLKIRKHSYDHTEGP
jgi:hypothetical protein